MSRFTKSILAVALVCATSAASFAIAAPLTNLGRPATDKEIAAWDIDVRPDFKGLPKGSGTVAQGQQVWESKCASCHGTFGESNEVFTPIVGGTTPDDVKTGRVASLASGKQPQKTTLMKLATVSTLWDFINRAMPWTAPKSLSTDEVYSVVAYILNLGEIVPDDFTLSDKTIAEAQKRMPNRNGMVTYPGLWDVRGKPDVKSVACMKDCPGDPSVHSSLPEVSRNVHGNLEQQNRPFGAVRGADTSKPAPTTRRSAGKSAAAAVATEPAASTADKAGLKLAQQNACVACHGVSNKIVGPGFTDIAAKYKGDAAAQAALSAKVRAGTIGTWGQIPMPAQANVKDEDIKTIVGWILMGAK